MKYSIEEITAKLDAIEQTMTEYQIPPQTYVIARDLLTEIDRLETLLQRSQETKKALADECERLTARAEQLALGIKSEWETNEELRSRLDRALALAATHLADQDLLVAQERKRVARGCINIVNNHAMDCGCCKRAADDIGATYEVDNG